LKNILTHTGKIGRLPDRVGEEGRWLVEDRPAGGAEPPGTRGAAARGEWRPLALKFKQSAMGRRGYPGPRPSPGAEDSWDSLTSG